MYAWYVYTNTYRRTCILDLYIYMIWFVCVCIYTYCMHMIYLEICIQITNTLLIYMHKIWKVLGDVKPNSLGWPLEAGWKGNKSDAAGFGFFCVKLWLLEGIQWTVWHSLTTEHVCGTPLCFTKAASTLQHLQFRERLKSLGEEKKYLELLGNSHR